MDNNDHLPKQPEKNKEMKHPLTKKELAMKYGFSDFSALKKHFKRDKRIVEGFNAIHSDFLTSSRHTIRPNEYEIVEKHWGKPQN